MTLSDQLPLSQPGPPRASPPNRKTTWSFILVGLLLGIVGGGFAVGQVQRILLQKSTYDRLSSRGIVTEAKIIALEEAASPERPAYTISYIFYGMDAELEPAWFAKNAPLTEDAYRRLRVADRVTVLFDPLDPNVSRIQRENRPPPLEAYIYAGLTVLMSLIGLAMFVKGIGQARHAGRPIARRARQ